MDDIQSDKTNVYIELGIYSPRNIEGEKAGALRKITLKKLFVDFKKVPMPINIEGGLNCH